MLKYLALRMTVGNGDMTADIRARGSLYSCLVLSKKKTPDLRTIDPRFVKIQIEYATLESFSGQIEVVESDVITALVSWHE